MKSIILTIISIFSLFSVTAAQAGPLTVTDAKIAAGRLQVSGKTPTANQSITLDGQFTIESDALHNYSFSVVYFPADCIVHLDSGGKQNDAVIANCATLARGVRVNGAISLSGIPNGRCSQVTFNVGGAKVGDSAIVSTRAAVQNGIVLYPNRVATDGHVEVNACNFSGTSMTPISGFPIKVVTFQ